MCCSPCDTKKINKRKWEGGNYTDWVIKYVKQLRIFLISTWTWLYIWKERWNKENVVKQCKHILVYSLISNVQWWARTKSNVISTWTQRDAIFRKFINIKS